MHAVTATSNFSTSKSFLVCVCTSENTYYKLPICCFNEYFLACRQFFDLAIAFNGIVSGDADILCSQYKPTYFFTRSNIGYDLDAFDYLLANVPLYDFFVLMHDDHYFLNTKWFDLICQTVSKMQNVDIFANLVKIQYVNSQQIDFVHAVAKACECEELMEVRHQFFAQGMAGVYRAKVIKWLMLNKGIPKIVHPKYLSGYENHEKAVAEAIERLVSLKLIKQGFRFAQLPPGYERFLFHKNCV